MHTTYIQQKLFEAGSVGTLHTRELIHLKTTLQGKFKIFTTSRKRGI